MLGPTLLLRLAPPCLITLGTGRACWGCGITRALVAAVHFDFGGPIPGSWWCCRYWRWSPCASP